MNDESIKKAVASMINDGRPAEALGLECSHKFHFLDSEWTYDDVRDYLAMHADQISERPDQFVLHLGMNNFRTAVFILMHSMGLLDETAHTEELGKRIAWLLDGSHHTVSCYDSQWREIIDNNRLLTDPPGLEWFATAPDTVTVFRGYCAVEGREKGICWTLDREVAINFAAGAKEGVVATARVLREDIAGALHGRESQILITDAEAIDIIDRHAL